MSISPTSALPVASPESAPDIHCRKCGYLQREAKADGICPECGILIFPVDPRLAIWVRNPAALRRLKHAAWGISIGVLSVYLLTLSWYFRPIWLYLLFAGPLGLAYGMWWLFGWRSDLGKWRTGRIEICAWRVAAIAVFLTTMTLDFIVPRWALPFTGVILFTGWLLLLAKIQWEMQVFLLLSKSILAHVHLIGGVAFLVAALLWSFTFPNSFNQVDSVVILAFLFATLVFYIGVDRVNTKLMA